MTSTGDLRVSGRRATATQGASGVEWRRTASRHSAISADLPAPGAPWKTIVPPPTRPSPRLMAAERNTPYSSSRPRKNGSRPTSERSVRLSQASSGRGSAGGGLGKGLSSMRTMLPQARDSLHSLPRHAAARVTRRAAGRLRRGW